MFVCSTVFNHMAQGELPVPRVVDFAHNSGDFSGGNSGSSSDGSHGPVRCQRCKAYVNCFCSWHKEGTAWVCNLCNMENPTPPWYRCPVDNFGQRADALERPELSCGSVDFNATGNGGSGSGGEL
jgi:protein transport protein SEC24